jgi:hypothetical protein
VIKILRQVTSIKISQDVLYGLPSDRRWDSTLNRPPMCPFVSVLLSSFMLILPFDLAPTKQSELRL